MSGNWCECGTANPPEALECRRCGVSLILEDERPAPLVRGALRMLRGLALVGCCAGCAGTGASVSLGVPGIFVFRCATGDGDAPAAEQVFKGVVPGTGLMGQPGGGKSEVK